MKIEYRKGDLFRTDIDTIVHGCNAQGVMGAGVAKVIRDRYPEAYKVYRDHYISATDKFLSSLPMGHICFAKSNDKIIINAVTQHLYGRSDKRYVSYDAVAESFTRINRRFGGDTDQIAMPKIGAGLAGGDWNVIEAIIESELKDIQPVVYTLD